MAAVAREGFIDRVIHHFIDQVVQAAGTGGTDVHTRTLAYRFEAFQDGDVAGTVLPGGFRGRVRLRNSLLFGLYCQGLCIVVSHRRFRLLCIR
jgi:hypothetical protein